MTTKDDTDQEIECKTQYNGRMLDKAKIESSKQ